MKRLFATLLALTMALSLAACGGSKGTTPAEDTSDTQEPAAEEPTDKELSGDLVLYSSMTESDLDALITCFNEKYPDINVEVVNGSAGELTTVWPVRLLTLWVIWSGAAWPTPTVTAMRISLRSGSLITTARPSPATPLQRPVLHGPPVHCCLLRQRGSGVPVGHQDRVL